MFKTTLEKRDAIVAGEFSAKDNVMQFLKKIASENPKINAFLHVSEQAIKDAEQVDLKIQKGESVGRLAGLAIGIKACINVEGLPANCASKVLENYISTYNADVINILKKEDGIIIGMLNMDEFACGGSGETSAFGKTDNPACPGRIPGGTSSGSAAAVAAGFCDFSLGSDTGGSIRNPASHCGVVGIKPSYGRVSRYGLIDMCMSFDQIGPLTTDVETAGLVMELISGYSENDATTFNKPVSALKPTRKVKSIGVPKAFKELCDPRIWDLIQQQLSKMEEHEQWELVEIEIPYVELAVQAYYPIVYVEFFSGTRKFDGRKYGKKIEEAVGPEVLRRIFGGREISRAEHAGKYYRKALQAKAAITEAMEKAFEKVDVIVCPTTPGLPHKFEEEMSVEQMYAADAFTIPANLAGICAGVVPVGVIDLAPIGLQVWAPAFEEQKLFDALYSIEYSIGKQH